MSDFALGVDLSEPLTRLVVVDDHGRVKNRADVAAVKGLRDAVKRLVADCGGVTAAGVAVGSPGDALPADARSAISGALKTIQPVIVPAGNAAAIAEHWCGAARDARHVIAFSIADHVSAGVVIAGEPWTGAHGLASSVGWMALNPVEREDYRRLGGLEAEVASAGIVRRLVWRIKSGDRSRVADAAGGDYSKITAADIFAAARSGDGVSISVVRDTAKYIGMAVANLAAMFDPDIIVLGGVIASSGDMMLDAIRVECGRRLRQQHFEQLRVELSTLGADAIAIGAARAAARSRA